MTKAFWALYFWGVISFLSLALVDARTQVATRIVMSALALLWPAIPLVMAFYVSFFKWWTRTQERLKRYVESDRE